MGSDLDAWIAYEADAISTHAPRIGSDYNGVFGKVVPVLISTHAPRIGSDPVTLLSCGIHRNFNPRSPYWERPASPGFSQGWKRFQPTLPVLGATCTIRVRELIAFTFQPTLPVLGATCSTSSNDPYKSISTHAPRIGSDSCTAPALPC